MNPGMALSGESIAGPLEAHWRRTVEANEIQASGNRWLGGLRLNATGEEEWYLEAEGRNITPVETIEGLGPLQKVWNALRARKIGGLSGVERFGTITSRSVNPVCGFRDDDKKHPNSIYKRSFLPIGQSFAAIPNLFPIEKAGQELLLEAEFSGEESIVYPHRPQVLNPRLISGLLRVARAAGDGWAIGYNSPGAGASVAHWHAHLVRRKFPVEEVLRIKVGDLFYPFGWPAGCVGVEEADSAGLWGVVDRLQQRRIPVNLLIRGGEKITVFIWGRNPRNELTSEFPSNIMAFFELAGVLVVSDPRVFAALTIELVSVAMRRTTMAVEKLFRILV